MSQKEESSSKDKWRDIAEQEVDETVEASSANVIDDAHLLPDETSISALIDKVTALEKQVDSYKDQLARGQAELINARHRMEQEVSKARKFGVERVVSDLIPIADSLLRGLEGVTSDDPSVQLMRKGMELTIDMLTKLLEKNGVLSIDPKVGDPFDPMQHEAMSMRSDSAAKANTVLQVLQKGYSLHGRVIRAAMVIVAA